MNQKPPFTGVSRPYYSCPPPLTLVIPDTSTLVIPAKAGMTEVGAGVPVVGRD